MSEEAEKVEVKRVAPGGAPTPPRRTLFERIHYTLGPVLGGLILDFADLATIGPLGLMGGWLIGGLVGFWIGYLYGIPLKWRLLLAGAAAAYCTMPLTGPLPIATVLTAIARFYESGQSRR